MSNESEPPRPRSTVSPSDIQIRYSSEGVLAGAHDGDYENTVTPWWAELSLADYPDNGDEPTVTSIGSIRGFLVDLDSDANAYETLDALEADLGAVGTALFQDDGIVDLTEIFPSHAIIIDRVWIDPEHRGQRLGPRAVAAAIRSFGRGRIAVAALIAQPDGWQKMTSRTLRDTRQKVRQAWEGIGFAPFDDEVLWLDATDYDGAGYFTDLSSYDGPASSL